MVCGKVIIRFPLQHILHVCRLIVFFSWISPVLSSGNLRRKQRRGSSSKDGKGASEKRIIATADPSGTMLQRKDSGARYRLRVVNSHPPRYLYQLGGTVVAHRAFFSLFRWEIASNGNSVDQGAHVLGDHSGLQWLSLLGNDRPAFSTPSSFLGLVPPNSNGTSQAQLFWPRPAQHSSCTPSTIPSAECFELYLEPVARSAALAHAPAHPTFISTTSEARSAPAIFQFERVLSSTSGASQPWPTEPASFAERTRRCKTKSLSGREFVLVTYHNIGMLDWAVLFWRWLQSSGLRSFMLLDLDGKTCSAAAALNSSLRFECATALDMASVLSPNMRVIRDASRMQEWGTDADSGYFKFLRWKLAVVELLLREGVDALMADVDVLVLSPSFFEGLAASPYDMTISSDARSGRYSDNRHCPCSHSAYQRYAADWVCAGLFYMRSTSAALWFIDEVVAMMDQYVITDQDAIQAVLTGHTQVAVPQTRRVNSSNLPAETAAPRVKSHAVMRGYRPSAQWLKPLWLEGLEPGETLRNMKGLQPLNTPMRPNMWERVSKRRVASGFNWTTAPVEKYANGPMLIEHWVRTFSREPASRGHKGGKGAKRRLDRFASVHANCNVKEFLGREENSGSFLLYP